MDSMLTPPQRILMGPGPSNVHPRVLDALSKPTVGHLDPYFTNMMEEIKDLLRYVFKTENEVTFPVSGPGSLGMETCIVNLVEPGMKVAVCQNGVFGGRMKSIVTRCGGKVISVDDKWGKAIDPAKLNKALDDNKEIRITAFVHAETSTGVISDIKTLTEIAHEHNCLTITDTVTSLGGSELLTDEWELDAVYSGTQKCLSCPPGLSPVSFNSRAVEAIKNRKTIVQSWFMDINLVLNYWNGGTKRSYHHTAPVNSLYGLKEALLMVKEEGIENAWKRHQNNSQLFCEGLSEIGLYPYVNKKERLPQLISVKIPNGIDEAAFRKYMLNQHGIEIGAGLGELSGKVWRIGLMGYTSNEENISLCLNALKDSLRKFRS